jgi:tetratricopeptide (TPR) repeat protein
VRAETRHQLKQDAFSRATMEAAERTAHWSQAHKNTLIVTGIVAVIVLGVGLGGWYYQSGQNDKASFEMSLVVRTLDTPLRPPGAPPQPEMPSFASASERAAAASKQLQAILDNYPHTRTADMARYMLGVQSVIRGDKSAAERDFKQAASSGPRELASMAKLALAGLYGNTSRTKEAIALYQELIKKPTAVVSKVTAQLQLAELYQTSNQPLDAKRLYEEIKKDNPSTEASQLATEKLAELK